MSARRNLSWPVVSSADAMACAAVAMDQARLAAIETDLALLRRRRACVVRMARLLVAWNESQAAEYAARSESIRVRP